MCGIAGYLANGHDASSGIVRAMCDRIRHRGPDDEGYHQDGPCAIGMRRLSIIDLDTGRQPIPNEDSTVWVVLNGEIYNYLEIRRGLAARGHRFETRSDTEVLVHLYEEEGPEGVEKLRGMFACAIWDARRRQLMLCRDRFGKKPLYYACRPEGLYFASELKCLRAAGVPLDTDDEALRLYLQFNYIPEPLSAFRQVRKLPPGCRLLSTPGGAPRIERYWAPPPPRETAPAGLDERALGGEIRRTFDESVRLRMIADVPLGAFLSGGIDSSLVVASMARQSSRPVKTFSIGFDETEFNELPYARLVARRYGTEHHELVVRPDAIELVSRLPDSFDEPFGDQSAIPTFLVSQFAARHVKVTLTGDGGDELFGGYNSFQLVNRWSRLDRLPSWSRALLGAAARRLPYGAYGKNFLRMASLAHPLERYCELEISPYFLRSRILQPGWLTEPTIGLLRGVFGDAILPDRAGGLSQAMHFETAAKLTGDILVKVDRMSMANSLEVRSPLLDHELAAVAARAPNAWKLRDGRGKWILLEALKDRLPAELLARPKRGFGVPLAAWFRGPLRELVSDHLTGARFLQRGIVNGPAVAAMLDEHLRGRRDNASLLWMLLSLELWFESVERVAHTEAAGR